MNEYPTEEQLDAIRKAEGWKTTLDLAIEAWDSDGVTFVLRPEEQAMVDAGQTWADEPHRYVRFATGGWSGNEDIISALNENVWARMNWQMSAAGGLHIYEYPT